MTPTRTTMLATTVAGVLLLPAACGADPGVPAGPDEVTPSPMTTSAPASPSPTASETPVSGYGTAGRMGEGSSEGGLVLVDVSVQQGRGAGRVVLRFSGTGTPGWEARYVADPRLEGSGDRVRLSGGAVLQVFASETTAPAPDYYDGPTRLRGPEGGVVEEVYVAGTFEGYTQVFAGVGGGRAPFRVTTLEDPSRLVLEVRDTGGRGRG